MQDKRLARILHAAIRAVDPGRLTSERLRNTPLPPHRRVYLLGMGKAAESMVRACTVALPEYADALVITKQRANAPSPPRVNIMEAGHPLPDARSLQAGAAVLEFVAALAESDLLLCLISGGASSLCVAPVRGISLADMQSLTTAALASGASIDEINILRRQLDQIKGGGLLNGTRCRIVSLILSDVIGDRLETIASGPTVPNPTDAEAALAVVTHHGIAASPAVRAALSRAPASLGADSLDRARNLVIGNNALARRAAIERAVAEGFSAEEINVEITGEAREAGRALSLHLAQWSASTSGPAVIIAGGETTVTLDRAGKGGRNQELALAGVENLRGRENCVFIAMATDGNDGPTDAAGAVVTGRTYGDARDLGMSAGKFLERHDSYSYFAALDDLIKPGYTGTNVNDLILLVAL